MWIIPSPHCCFNCFTLQSNPKHPTLAKQWDRCHTNKLQLRLWSEMVLDNKQFFEEQNKRFLWRRLPVRHRTLESY